MVINIIGRQTDNYSQKTLELTTKIAFTLAEVLITLGIIGIVAEMTIPTLMQNVQDAQFRSAAKVAYSNASQVLTQMKNDGKYIPNQTSHHNFKTDFISYFKVLKDCGNADECVTAANWPTVYHNINGDPGYFLFNDGQFTTLDGMFYAIYDGTNWSQNVADVIIVVDVNGYQKPPNVVGKDAFAFIVDNDTGTLKPSGDPTTDWFTSGHCAIASWSTDWGCMYYIMLDPNYKIQ